MNEGSGRRPCCGLTPSEKGPPPRAAVAGLGCPGAGAGSRTALVSVELRRWREGPTSGHSLPKCPAGSLTLLQKRGRGRRPQERVLPHRCLAQPPAWSSGDRQGNISACRAGGSLREEAARGRDRRQGIRKKRRKSERAKAEGKRNSQACFSRGASLHMAPATWGCVLPDTWRPGDRPPPPPQLPSSAPSRGARLRPVGTASVLCSPLPSARQTPQGGAGRAECGGPVGAWHPALEAQSGGRVNKTPECGHWLLSPQGAILWAAGRQKVPNRARRRGAADHQQQAPSAPGMCLIPMTPRQSMRRAPHGPLD